MTLKDLHTKKECGCSLKNVFFLLLPLIANKLYLDRNGIIRIEIKNLVVNSGTFFRREGFELMKVNSSQQKVSLA